MKSMIIVGALAALMVPSLASGQAFQNGGFESATVDPGAGFTQLNTGSTAITGWTVTGASIDYIGGYWQPYEGSRSIDLNGAAGGGISQTFDTVVGRNYTVRFALAGNPDGGPDSKVLSTIATANGSQTYSFDTSGTSRTDMGWQVYSYSFVGNGVTTLAFTSSTPGAYGAALDAVSLGGVPEPAAWAMMIGGFGLVGSAARRRRASARVAIA